MPYDHRRRKKLFEAYDVVQAIVNTWYRALGFRLHSQVYSVLDVDESSWWRWRRGDYRPDTTALRRMLRLLLWKQEGLQVRQLAAVDWDGLDVTYLDSAPDYRPNPFVLSPETPQSPAITFPFGSLRDNSAMLQTWRDLFGLERHSHMMALLGLPAGASSHEHFNGWMTGRYAIGPMYLARLMALTLIALDKLLDLRLDELWSVDWKARTVRMSHASLAARRAEDPHYRPPNPFHRLAITGQAAVVRRRRSFRSLAASPAAAPVPTRTYSLAADL